MKLNKNTYEVVEYTKDPDNPFVIGNITKTEGRFAGAEIVSSYITTRNDLKQVQAFLEVVAKEIG